jgi:hypothetical protein
MDKPNSGAGVSSLDRIRKVQPSFDGDRSDRQNLADTMKSSPERAHLLLTPPTESDRMGMVDEDAVTPIAWFQRDDVYQNIQQELIIPKSRISPVVVVLTMAAGAIVMGGAIWLLVF